MGVRWYGSNAGSCGFYASQRNMSRSNALRNVAVTSITRTASGHYIGRGGGVSGSSAACPSPSASASQSDVYEALQAHAKTGRGITKPQLKAVAQANLEAEQVSAPARAAIKQAADAGLFATKKGAEAAQEISQSKTLSLLQIRAL